MRDVRIATRNVAELVAAANDKRAESEEQPCALSQFSLTVHLMYTAITPNTSSSSPATFSRYERVPRWKLRTPTPRDGVHYVQLE
jgi:hypothetical protein